MVGAGDISILGLIFQSVLGLVRFDVGLRRQVIKQDFSQNDQPSGKTYPGEESTAL